jgi:hypothetical protein
VTDPIFDARIASIDATADSGMHAPDVVAATVVFLRVLAGDGPALEFGIGTGRIAIPLQDTVVSRLPDRYITSHGGRVCARDRGGKDIDVTIGDSLLPT